MAENERVRVMPRDEGAERAVLGGIYMNNKAIVDVKDLLPSGDAFYNSYYRTIYEAMLALHAKNMKIDMVTLQAQLTEMNAAPEIASAEFLIDAVKSVDFIGNVTDYARVVYNKYSLRELIKATNEIRDNCYESDDDVSEILSIAEKKIVDIVQNQLSDAYVPIKTYVSEALNQINEASKREGKISGLATGFTDLDNMTSGFLPGNLVILAARPAMGKTALALSIAENISVRNKKPVLVFSLEMSGAELVKRILSMESGVDSMKYKSGELDEGEMECLLDSAGNVASSGLIVRDDVFRLGEIRSLSRRLKAEKDIEMIVVDYLQLVNVENAKNLSREQQISEISRSLKLLAKELKIPVMALSQLSREVEKRSDKRPELSDLRESGAIEQDADLVMFIYRDEVYNPGGEDNKGVAEILIKKQRSGSTGTVRLYWMAELTQFKNLTHEVI
ncbi:MAG: replicative DNA helicase [Lachnospiraceae bacterium]|nr:replicative DNA helicase [Lachnospiraceae bacterium]